MRALERSIKPGSHRATTYHRYLVTEFRAAFKLKGVPLIVEFKTGDNPFKGRKNELTGRQVKKRERMVKRRKG